jgi:hypothetical protein
MRAFLLFSPEERAIGVPHGRRKKGKDAKEA